MLNARDTAEPIPLAAQPKTLSETRAPILEMRGIEKKFGSNVALNQVDFDLVSGEIHALLGENGAGKSTLMQILSGLSQPDGGRISLRGSQQVIRTPNAARKLGIAMVHQHFTLAPAFTVSESLALDHRAPQPWFQNLLGGFGFDSRKDSEPSIERAKALGWKLDPNAKISELPVGAQQRVEIVKALATDSDILIFDEPTAVLSAEEIDELFTALRRLKSEGKSVILIAHKLSEILEIADRVTVLRRGVCVATADVADTNAERLAEWMVGERVAATANAGAETANPEKGEKRFECRDLKVKGDRGEMAIESISFTVAKGEIFGISGVDGNGQTELAETLVGLRDAFSGDLSWKNGAFKPGAEIKYGYIPQDRRRSGLAVSMSVADNLIFDAVNEREFQSAGVLKAGKLKQLAEDLIAQFDIRTNESSLPVSSLSGGNQQKIVIARAFRRDPDWIVAVNPTRGLDITATKFVHEQLRGARAKGAAIVLISTDLDEISALADRAGILSKGSLSPYDLSSADSVQIGLLLGGAGKQERRQ